MAVSWPVYKEWESETIARLLQPKSDPAKAWVESIGALSELAGRGPVDPDFESTVQMGGVTDEIEATAPDEETDSDDSAEFVPTEGIGRASDVVAGAADILLSDMAFWAELLVGLEAADPMALRRFRSGMLRLRMSLGHEPDAAPVLAEIARLAARELQASGGPMFSTTDELLQPTDPIIDSVSYSPRNPEVQRRFLTQALMDKRLFEFGTVGRGLIALTLHLALLRLGNVHGDEMHPRLEDMAYLLHHPQLTDVIDTRAVVRATDGQPAIHAAILGI